MGQITEAAGDYSSPDVLDAFHTTGSSPTVHLLGPGNVGRALLGLLLDAGGHRLVGVTDRSGTVHDPYGLRPERVIEVKERGGTLVSAFGGCQRPLHDALLVVDADVVMDVTATDFARPQWAHALDQGAVRRGKTLVLAAKDAVASHIDRWSDPALAPRVGINAVLGGTGRRLMESLPELRNRWREVACAGSASTTAIVQILERGGSLVDGVRIAGERGFLEADPELDLRGVDAAVKLSIVEAVLTGAPGTPVEGEDIRTLDPETLRERFRRGSTTRLVGRVRRDGDVSLRYEEVSRGSALEVDCHEAAYTYGLTGGETRVYEGRGLGYVPTAEALLADLLAHRPPVPAGLGGTT